jgi:ferritin
LNPYAKVDKTLREIVTRVSVDDGFSSTEFLRRYENNELQETLDFAEWVGEYRLLERLREKADTL